MKNELDEDIKDLKDIKAQKEELKKTKEEMSSWELRKGLKEKEKKNNGV